MNRVSVVGATGSGKTTFARRLADILGVPCVELDNLHHGPHWTIRDDFVARATEAVAGERWVVDGNYPQVRSMVWERADTVVWLHYSLPVMMGRLWRRTIHRVRTKEPVWDAANTESLRTALGRDGIVWWQFRTYRRRRREYPQHFADPRWAHLEVVTLRSPAEADAWLAAVRAPG